MRSCLLIAAVVGLSSCRVAMAADEVNSFAAQFAAFSARHCIECHGSDDAQANLRLDTLPRDFTNADTASRWIKVLDKVTRGEMPPVDAPLPPAAEVKNVTAALRAELHAASLAKQQREGRVLIRRLNRTEYQTTLRDLLGVDLDVSQLLPDDGTASGFDNVSTVLETSAVHLLRYQRAAEQALPLTLPKRPQDPFQVRRLSGREAMSTNRFFKEMMLDKFVKFDDDKLVAYVRMWDHIPLRTPSTPYAGRYRIRTSAYAINTDVPIPVRLTYSDPNAVGNRMLDMEDLKRQHVRDVRPGAAQVIELELEMNAQSVVTFLPFTLPNPRTFGETWKGKPLAEYTGPAVVFEWIELEGPEPNWPSQDYVRLYDDVPLKQKSVAKAEAEGKIVKPRTTPLTAASYAYDPLAQAPVDPRADAERLVRRFLPRAFRRPVDEALVDYYVKIVQKELDAGRPFTEALHEGYKAALCSPHFLFLTETIDPVKGDRATALDGYALATRLSYFLWSSLPDDELTATAARGELQTAAGRHKQVERMLGDPKASRFTDNFAGQWLDLRRLNETSPDRVLYGEFDDYLFWSMPLETTLYFEEILKHDRSVTEFTHSDWTFLNERLAQHYGIEGVHGGELRKVKLSPEHGRGGVLGHASIHKVTADGTKTSPILRGKWVLEKIIGRPPEPPPPNVPAVEPDIRGATSIRQQLDLHRNIASCNACHQHIDPPGFALEAYDPIGGKRDFYRASTSKFPSVDVPNYPGKKVRRGLDVEPSGQAADGRKFRDLAEYKQLLLADKAQLARNVIEKLVIYSTGAEIQFADREEIERLVAAGKKSNYGLRSLIHEVVESRIFLKK